MDLAEYQRLKRRAEEMQREADRATGQLEMQMKQLKRDFGCSTIKEAESLLNKLKADQVTAEACFQKELAEFNVKWGQKLE